jgi:hypothetical protein
MTKRLRIHLAALLLFAATYGAGAQSPSLPTLQTNEAMIEDVLRESRLAVDDPMAVFAFVFGSLPERVRVYPTENHYYFAFFHNGVRYAGNIKIDARLREEGKVAFVYYEELQGAVDDDDTTRELTLGPEMGVAVVRVNALAYKLTFRQKSVTFELNDLSQVKPPAMTLGPDEKFIGPIFDESAVRFFLVFNEKLKIFHYILDETAQATDVYTPAIKGNDRILLGKRSGFAFYRDHGLDRKILIGVYEINVIANNYFDGPFDQIPDNFLAGDTFKQAIVAADPDLKDEIDRFGGFPDGSRYIVAPYMHYRSPEDLAVFHRCATDRRVPAADYYKCFVLEGEERGPDARPLAMPRDSR